MSLCSVAVFCLLLAVVSAERGGYGFESNSPDVEPEGWYIVGRPGESCVQSCWELGYEACMSGLGDTDTVIDNLYYLVPTGGISLERAEWSEEYHPIVDADNSFVGWDVIPELGGSCDSYPPDFTQRRLCRCSDDDCRDVFRWCSALRYVCHKYSYTRKSCPETCGVCTKLPDMDDMMP